MRIYLYIGDIVQCQLYSAERKVVPAHGKALIDTQLSIAVPPGTYGRVAPRSGLGLLHRIGYGIVHNNPCSLCSFQIYD